MRQKDLVYLDLLKGGSKYVKVSSKPMNQIRIEKIKKIKNDI